MAETRGFSDEEVREILTAAAERQAAADKALVASRPGMSLAELEQIAAEAGIDPAHVRAVALRRGDEPTTPTVGRNASGEYGIQASRHLPAPVSPETWGRIVSELRSAFGAIGVPSEFGETREWVSAAGSEEGLGSVQVTLEREGEGTRLKLWQSGKQYRSLAYVPTVVFAVAAVAFTLLAVLSPGAFDKGPYALPLLFGGFTAASAIGGPVGLQIWKRNQSKRFQTTMDRIELIVRDGADEERRLGSGEA